MISFRGFELVKDCQRAVVYTIFQVLVNSENFKPNVNHTPECIPALNGPLQSRHLKYVDFVFALKEASIV